MGEKDIVKTIRKLAITKQLNFLIGSGASLPAIPLMSDYSVENRNDALLKKVIEKSKIILSGEEAIQNDTDILETIQNYERFILSIIQLLNYSNSRQTPKNINIFTTNYDLFIEKAIDIQQQKNYFVFNDGSRGYFNRILDSSNYNSTASYKGLNDNYINEIPCISLIKPHGSVNWEKFQYKNSKFIKVNNFVPDNPVVVPPTGYEQQETFLNDHFHEMLRVFQLELDKPQSVLFVIGFSFQDSHIAKMIRRACLNPELMIYIFAYNIEDRVKIMKNLNYISENLNCKILIPEDFGTLYENSIPCFTIKNLTDLLNIGKNEDDFND
ncbi:SIR2 family protein [uncultured Granulicatella sp.]|jgi:hypothetical protein|uniref:SIR2 family protein n=1 Tax=uncultured Granulicatella sp. TaxID=316089 RepID=UPI0028D4840B|nr:SIR2 family protein [uncultured Granulicatella sp.]